MGVFDHLFEAVAVDPLEWLAIDAAVIRAQASQRSHRRYVGGWRVIQRDPDRPRLFPRQRCQDRQTGATSRLIGPAAAIRVGALTER